jgi:hypothetical protein
MSRPGYKIQIWWCLDWRCKCWHVGAILGEHHSWTEVSTGPEWPPQYDREDGWSIIFRGGQVIYGWFLRTPTNYLSEGKGLDIGLNPNLSADHIPEAILWATQAIAVLGGECIEPA